MSAGYRARRDIATAADRLRTRPPRKPDDPVSSWTWGIIFFASAAAVLILCALDAFKGMQ